MTTNIISRKGCSQFSFSRDIEVSRTLKPKHFEKDEIWQFEFVSSGKLWVEQTKNSQNIFQDFLNKKFQEKKNSFLERIERNLKGKKSQEARKWKINEERFLKPNKFWLWIPFRPTSLQNLYDYFFCCKILKNFMIFTFSIGKKKSTIFLEIFLLVFQENDLLG